MAVDNIAAMAGEATNVNNGLDIIPIIISPGICHFTIFETHIIIAAKTHDKKNPETPIAALRSKRVNPSRSSSLFKVSGK